MEKMVFEVSTLNISRRVHEHNQNNAAVQIYVNDICNADSV